MRAWRFNPKVSGGGIIMDGHVHHIAYFLHLLNNPPIDPVYAEYGTLNSTAQVEDTAVTQLRTSRALAEIDGSNRLLEPNAQMGRSFEDSIDIFGSRGALRIHPTERPSLTVHAPETRRDEKLAGGWIAPRLEPVPFTHPRIPITSTLTRTPWVAEHQHFVDSCLNDQPVVSDGHFGRTVQEVLMTPHAAGREGRGCNSEARRELADEVGVLQALPARLEHCKCMAHTMNRVGETARRNGVKTSIHPHGGTVAESRLEIELLLSLLDADLVGFAPDTGQIAKGGADPMPIIERCASMLRYLYMKDLSPEWESMRRERIPLRSPEGQSETGQGIIDFRRLLPILAAFNYSGWLMAELDEAKRPPREAAALSKDDIAHTLGLALRQPVPSVRSIARAKARG